MAGSVSLPGHGGYAVRSHSVQSCEGKSSSTVAEASFPASAGINTGVMLFRNTAWSRSLLDELYGYALLGDRALQEMKAVRLSSVHSR